MWFEYKPYATSYIETTSHKTAVRPPTTLSQKTSKLNEQDMQDAAGEVKDEIIRDVLLWTPSYDEQVLDNQLELIYNNTVRTQVVAGKPCRKRWTIKSNGERGSRKIRASDMR